MKKQFFFMLSLLAIALPLSLSLQSCGDDDDDPQVTNTELSGSDTGNNGTGGGDTGGDDTGGGDTGGGDTGGGNTGGDDTGGGDTGGGNTGGKAPEAIDLGLPSGIKWASCNLGASSQEEYGDYYAWGETEPKSDYSGSTYLTLLGGSIISLEDYGTSKDPLRAYVYGGSSYNVATKAGVADGIGGTKYDVARVKLGGKWRMPTMEEIKELLNICTWTLIKQNGVYGRLVKSQKNGNSIFLPAAGYRIGTSLDYAGSNGYFWCSTPYGSCSYKANGLRFLSDNCRWHEYNRSFGLSVRPVSE